jgi:hypothetical protein
MQQQRPTHTLAFVTYALATAALGSAVALGAFVGIAPAASPPPPPPKTPTSVVAPSPPPTMEQLRALLAQAPKPVIDDEPALTRVRATKGAVTKNANARARWNGIQKSPGCWFFSGPAPLGRDHQYGESARLEENGKQVTVRFGGAAFTGDNVDGRVTLRRAMKKGDDGWRFEETIRGSLKDGVLVGRYLYRECSLDESGTCVLGATSQDHCRIEAFLHVDAD